MPVGPPTIIPPDSHAIADSGSTAHFCTVSAHLINKLVTSRPIGITNPNGTEMYSTHEAELDLPSLPFAARRVHIVPALSTASLLSMGQLCDSGCCIVFDACSVKVYFNDDVILAGERTTATGLWHLSLHPPTPLPAQQLPAPSRAPLVEEPLAHPHFSHAAVTSATPAELVAFGHAALFSPALSTLRVALARGYVAHFPGLTTTTLTKHPPHSFAMVKGHLDQTRKNQRSTKSPPVVPEPLPPTDIAPEASFEFPSSDHLNQRTHHCFAAIIEPATGQIHTDQTGRFIVASSTGNNYILVLYDYDSNSILVAPMRSRTAGPCILAAFQLLHARLVAAGLRPQLQRLDNECSTALKQFLHAEHIDYQLVPPGHPPPQRCRTCDSHVQEPFYRRSMQCRPTLPITPMGQIVAPGGINPQPPPRLTPQPHRVNTCPNARRI
jgi:hypothetical protein